MNQSVRTFKYIVSLILLLLSLKTNAQHYEKRERDWKPSEFYLSADLVGLTKLVSDNDFQFEVQGKIDFDRYYLVLDWGITQLELSGDDFEYGVQGNFFRIGPQVNLMPYNELRSNIYFGIMYGQSNFSDEILYSRSTVHWPEEDLMLSNSNLVSRWAEVNLGINARIYKSFYMGFIVRFKFVNTLSGAETLNPYTIPGYGKADELNRFGFNYFLTYRIPFRDKPIGTKPRYIAAPKQRPEEGANSQGRESKERL